MKKKNLKNIGIFRVEKKKREIYSDGKKKKKFTCKYIHAERIYKEKKKNIIFILSPRQNNTQINRKTMRKKKI